MGVSVPAVAGTLVPSLRSRSLCCRRMFSSTSAQVGASVPMPHAISPKPAAPAHAARARCRRPAAHCPAPTAAWVRTGATGDTHPSILESLAPSRRDIKTSRRSNRSPRHHEPSRHCRPGRACVPGSRAAATRTLPSGGPRAAPMLRSVGLPHPRQHPAAHLLNRDLLAGLRGPCHLLFPRAEGPAPATQDRTLVIPSTTSSTWLIVTGQPRRRPYRP